MHQSAYNPRHLQNTLGDLEASLGAYLGRNLQFSELRTRWITGLANSPEVGKDALRLLFDQPMDGLLTEERVLTLKRIVETSICEIADDWTVAFDDDGNDVSLPIPNREVRQPSSPDLGPPLVNPIQKERSDAKPFAPQSTSSASRINSAGTLASGHVLCDRFLLEEPLGRGGIGIVYKARDRLRQNAIDGSDRIALKVLREEIRSNREWRDALQREAFRAQSLSHPNIVRVYDFRQDGETSFVTMELLAGESLAALFARTQPAKIQIERAMRIISGICHGLAYAHRQNVVHADFKPANVFVTSADEPKILDFGFTGVGIPKTHQAPNNPALRVFTPAYASCNRLEGGAPAVGDDVYSLCCVIYELLAGHHPYDRKSGLEARDLGLKPKRVDELTDRQWDTLSAGLRPAPGSSKTEVHDIQEVFAEDLPAKQRNAPLIANPEVKKVVVRKRGFASAVFSIASGAFLGAAVVVAMVLLGIQPVPSKYIDLARESALVKMLQATFGSRAEEPTATGNTESSELLRDELTGPEQTPPDAVIASPSAEQTAKAEPVDRDSAEAVMPIPAANHDDLGELPPTLSADPEADGQNFGGNVPSNDVDAEISAQGSSSAVPALGGEKSKSAADPQSAIVPTSDATTTALSGDPAFYLGRAVYFVQEDGVALAVQVHRQGDVSASSSVQYTTVPESADPQSDFAGTYRGLVQFAAGERAQYAFIPIVSDEVPESDERFLIVLSPASDEMLLLEPFTATATIIDDD